MQLIRSTDSDQGAQLLGDRIRSELQAGNRVLWLIPGGSNIPISKAIMDTIDDSLTNLLSLTLTDERYGPVGHIDSNWQQLDDIGFDSKSATRYDVLLPGQASIEDATYAFGQTIEQLFRSNDVIIGQFGMGADGHIAGILPYSAAASSMDWTAGYHTESHDRITLTFKAIEHCTAAYLFAFGSEKRQALERLQDDRELEDQPAQVIKTVPEAFVCNDQIGESL